MIKLSFTAWFILAFAVLCTNGAALEPKIISSILGAPAAIPLESRVGEPLDTTKLERDVKALWRSGRFSDIRVEAIDHGPTVGLLFRGQNKPILRLRKFQVTPATPGVNLELEPHSAVDALSSQQIATGIRRQLESSGFPDAKVEATLLPAGPGWADLQVHIEKGQSMKVKEVTLSGELGVKPSDAFGALRATKRRTMLPRIPGLWKGWRLAPNYEEGAVQSDLANLRSFYYKRGYFDANINLNSVDTRGDGARIDLAVHSGKRYAIRQLSLFGVDGVRRIPPESDAGFPAQSVCSALLAERRKAERSGVLDFTARIEVRDAPGAPPAAGADAPRWVDLVATVQRGPAYRVGRIEFRGNHTFGDLTVRRMFLINEGEPLDDMLLRKSLARLNRTGFFEPLSESDVVVNTAPGSDHADVTIRLREKKPGHWLLSGPVGPMSVAGPLRLAIGSRLPSWGQGIFELSTYTASMNLAFFAKPLSNILPFLPHRRFLPALTIRRPLLPGQRFLSGFVLTPQFGWKGTLTGYGVSQTHDLLGALFQSDRAYTPGLTVTIAHAGADGPHKSPEGAMYCELPKAKLEWVRQVSGAAVNLLFSFMPF